ncbi:alpha-L-fucosidase [Pedobacter rhizosphaerae]|uniref:alpha-L-fucosidase n=1 Tax=Pedobacter rhizosphaerae TaxID=390241 RepID=A0A1H9VXD4_9SPHI|nr:alpha-L-fucosidase [Pedobacter rhizosphaerae]SES26460.1 alpha-L-fucosidase [Pedobacter rhizosphaerae]
MNKRILMLLLGIVLCLQLYAQEQNVVQKADTKWFPEAKLGLFLHYGLYAIPAGVWKGKEYKGVGEWIQERAKIPISEYEQLATQFNPQQFDANEWVLFAKDCGFKYIVITTKHHDGFAMYKSDVSKFNIVDATPFKRDIIRELADACKKHGMKLGFYYSQSRDWHEADAEGNLWDFKGYQKNFQKYLDEKCKPQLQELLTRYGDVALIWFDGGRKMSDNESTQLVNWVHKFQPNCLTSSRIGNGRGDYETLSDNKLPTTTTDQAYEALFTHNFRSWGYSKTETKLRTPQELMEVLLNTISKGANLLLNIGPKPEGVFQEESIRDFRIIGKWINANAEAIYGSKGSPFPEMPWGYITSKPGALYLHVTKWPEDQKLSLPLNGRSSSAKFLVSGKKIKSKIAGENLLLSLPAKQPDEMCTVIKVSY